MVLVYVRMIRHVVQTTRLVLNAVFISNAEPESALCVQCTVKLNVSTVGGEDLYLRLCVCVCVCVCLCALRRMQRGLPWFSVA